MKAFVDQVWWDQGGKQVHLAIRVDRGAERRVGNRVKYTRAVALQLTYGDGSPGRRVEAIARDLSVSGVAMVTGEEVPVGGRALVTLDLRLPTQRDVPGVIVRSAHVAGDFHDTAVHFDQPIEM